MKLSDIKPGRWYATRFGIAQCTGWTGTAYAFQIGEESRTISPRDVYGEAKKPEVTP